MSKESSDYSLTNQPSTSTAGKVNSTIVWISSSEEDEPFFTPPSEQPRKFLEDRLNVTSKIQLFPLHKNTAPIATQSVAPPNNILSDVMKGAADREKKDILPEATEKVEEPVNPVEAEDNNLIFPLLEIFPEACPQFIRRICRAKTNAPGVLDCLISKILESDYPKRNKPTTSVQGMDAKEQLEMLKQILPDADPSYLEIECDRMMDNPDHMKNFVANALENPSYPKLKDYLRRQQISAQQKQYTTEFSVKKFVEVIPDPEIYFEDPKRKQPPYNICIQNEDYAIGFLRNHFCKIPLNSIKGTFRTLKWNFLKTFKILEQFDQNKQLKQKRRQSPMPTVIQYIPLLQEMAYVQHSQEIKDYIHISKVNEQNERAAAGVAGKMKTCSCCFDNEVLPKHIYRCEKSCTFCIECIQRATEIAFGEGKLDFACLNNCPSHFSLKTLQAVLNPKLFSKIAIKKQVEEVKAAGIEDLEMCPFCDFATIPAKEDKIFRCLNPECMKESCRLCKEPSHVPLRCEEVEKDTDVKKRTYIENKMTEALLRTCYNCNKKFIKDEGCNKMTCSCGALMCYICGKPVIDYKHFNGPGGDNFNLCPLYSDTNKMHRDAVIKVAQEAKKEVGIDDISVKLKIDPTSDVKKHYDEVAKKHPPPPVFPYVNPFVRDPPEANREQLLIPPNQLQLEELRRQREVRELQRLHLDNLAAVRRLRDYRHHDH